VASPSPNSGIPNGGVTQQINWGEYNAVAFAIQQALAKMQTATLVKIISCTNAGDLSPVGLVDVLPLVNQLDASRNPTPHVTIHNLPYMRVQGGKNAIIMDPQEGDIGLACFCSRDISKVKSTKDQANPGSWRQYSFSDGVYLGGMLNGTPNQFIQYLPSGINITTQVGAVGVTVNAPVGNVMLTAGAGDDAVSLNLIKDKGIILTYDKRIIMLGYDGLTSITDGISTISLNDDGTITVNAPVSILVNSPNVEFTGNVKVDGYLEAPIGG
jgi:hypothetical protein